MLFGWPYTRALLVVYKTAQNQAGRPGTHCKLLLLVCIVQFTVILCIVFILLYLTVSK
jgi:hypothetical protein